jgi:MarR family transcriptional regulator for hemolysin
MQSISADAITATDAPGSRLGPLVGMVYRQWRRQMDLDFKDLDLSDASRMPLLMLHRHGEAMRQKDLAQALHLDPSSLVRVLTQLRSAGLLEWSCAPADRRTKYIALTSEGRRLADLINERSQEIEQAILADLSADELQATRAALLKISQRFSQLQAASSTP